MIIKYDDLKNSDLIKGRIYRGGSTTLSDLFKIEGFKKSVGNASGFEPALIEKDGKTRGGEYAFVVLLDTGNKNEWPNKYDNTTKILTYYGDNKEPGNDIHNTKKGGNKFLFDVFEKSYKNKEDRMSIPPIFIFKAKGEGGGREFIGLGVPGVVGESKDDCLKRDNRNGVDNYVAKFTVLNTENISREWLKDLKDYYKSNLSENAPSEWIDFIEDGINSIKNNISEKNIIEDENKFINEFNEEIDIEVFENIELEEGKIKEKFIKLKERNKKVRDLKINDFKKKNGKVFCEVCGIDELVVLDVHHEKIKVSEMRDNHKTGLNDLNILCANCHRKLHGYNLTISELKKRLIMV